MIGTPDSLLETQARASDALSDLLDGMRLSGAVLFRAEFREPWSVATPDCRRLAQILPLRTERMIPFHVAASGACWIEMRGSERIWLNEGDVVCMPFGGGHRLGGREPAESVPLEMLLPNPPWGEGIVVKHGGAGADAGFVCGFVQCDELVFDPILRHLPILLHVSPSGSPADAWLASTTRHTVDEATRLAPGSRSMPPRLTEVMFVEILRKHMQGLSPQEVGWFAAYNDPVVGAALRRLHAAPFLDWSVDELARHARVSRTILTERFKHFLDAPPMQYLAHWRLRLAAQRLKSTDLPVKTIADECSYESEAAFSRAFKRRFGLPPGDWRKHHARH